MLKQKELIANGNKIHKMPGKKKLTLALVSALMLGMVGAASAQETSSAMRGQITGPDGAPAANTKVIIVHVPSGTTKTVETNAAGQYSARGLRVGGPYKVVIDSDVYRDQKFDDIYLELGRPYQLTAELEADTMEEVVVTAQTGQGFFNRSLDSAFDAEQIANATGGNRDLKDVVRSNPLAVVGTSSEAPLSIAGQNPRYNSFSVDGVAQNDDFGLNANGYPTQRSPISVDAIEQVTLSVAPFNVLAGNFSGGSVNAVTKSGTNEFHGSVFYQKDISDQAGSVVVSDDKTYGFTLGGPIIKDKLFFFASYDKFTGLTPVRTFSGDGVNGTNITQASVDQVTSIAQNVYGVDIGSPTASPSLQDEKFLMKVDWNINEDHRASFTYQNTDGNTTRNLTSSDRELRLSTHFYDKNESLEVFSSNLYSNWTEDFSTDIKLAYKKVATGQDPITKDFGDITVYTDVDSRGRPQSAIAFGPDQYRHGNSLSNDTLTFRFVGNYLMGDHELAFGMDYNSIDVNNLFAPNSLGRWEFDSIEDFQNGNASRFVYANAFTNNVDDAAAAFTLSTAAFFAQDSWDVNDTLDVTYGLRVERIGTDKGPTTNPNFVDRYGFSNSATMDGEITILPRIGFNWDATDTITVKGGVGRFGGGRPNVWLSNSYSNDGITYVEARNTSDFLTGVDITQIPQGVLNAMEPGDGNVNLTDPDFKLPTDWRINLGMQYVFGPDEDWELSLDFTHIKKENSPIWKDLSRHPAGTTADGGRVIYQADDLGRYDLMLTNADKNGRSNIFTAALHKNWDFGLDMNVSYTHQDITEGTPGTSSTAKSNFRYPIVGADRNAATIGTAEFEIEHRFVLNLEYTKEFFADYATKFNMYLERRSGRPFSWVLGSFRDGGFGDQFTFQSQSVYLPYIPAGPSDPNVVYDGISYDELMGYFTQVGLDQYAGGYAPKGSDHSPWINTLDVNITQEIPGFMDGHKGEVFLNINNFLNLAGEVLENRFNNRTIVDFSIDDQGRYVYEEPFRGFNTQNWDQRVNERSSWSVDIGVRYRF
ncbi:MAG: TonB-dependent receptor [bacterium]